MNTPNPNSFSFDPLPPILLLLILLFLIILAIMQSSEAVATQGAWACL